MFQGQSNAAPAPGVKAANINSVIEDFGREIIRATELGDRVRNLADRMAGGKPRDAGAGTQAQPESSVHLSRLQERRAWLSSTLNEIEEHVARLENTIL